MSDIVDRLEERAVSYEQSGPSAHHTASLLREAKNEIEHLAADIVVKARILTAQTKEIGRLRAVEAAARDYYLGYVQDEADDKECCIVEEQHEHAKALRDALGEK